MKKSFCFILIICIFIQLCSFSAFAVSENDNITASDTLEYVDGEIIVMTNYYVAPENYNYNDISMFHGIEITSIEPLFNNATEADIANYADKSGNCFPYLITITEEYDINDAIETLNEDSQIIISDKNYIIESEYTETVTSSSSGNTRSASSDMTAQQWALDYLEMESVWASGFTGSDDVVVAIIDDNFGLNHEDLQFDTANAYNATERNTNIPCSDSHGNMVSGIIGAEYGNDIGIDGICQNVTILPIVMEEEVLDVFIHALCYAIEKNTKVIVCSLYLPFGCDPLIVNGIANAQVLVVTAAGNYAVEGNGSIGRDMIYETNVTASCNNSPYWIVAGASNSSGEKWISSNYSKTYCDLLAPGQDILSTALTGYATESGTSFAAPHLAAACALIMGTATHLTALEVKNIILNNVDVVDGFDDYCVTGGILSIKNAVDAIYAENRGAYTKGDVNGDGYVTNADYELCREICFGTVSATANQTNAADINDDGSITAVDYMRIKRYCNKTSYFIP